MPVDYRVSLNLEALNKTLTRVADTLEQFLEVLGDKEQEERACDHTCETCEAEHDYLMWEKANPQSAIDLLKVFRTRKDGLTE